MSGRKRRPDKQKAAGRIVKIQRRGKFRNVKDKDFQKMTSASWIKRKWHHRARMSRSRNVREKKCPDKQQPTGKPVKIQKCQEQIRSRDSGSIRQRCREQETSRTNTSKRSRRQHPSSQAVRRCSYRFSLIFIGSSLSRNFRHPACPGSTWIRCRYIYIIYIYR